MGGRYEYPEFLLVEALCGRVGTVEYYECSESLAFCMRRMPYIQCMQCGNAAPIMYAEIVIHSGEGMHRL